MWQNARIAVVVPAYNEQRLIARTLLRIPVWVDRIIVVDDASSDSTHQVVRRLQAARVTCIRHHSNRGVGAAIATGYRQALADDADVIAVMAADDQMDPGDLPGLLAPVVERRADYAKGNRFAHPLARDMPRLRHWGSRALSLATRLLTGLPIDDTQCGYTALSASAARRLPLDELWPRYGYPNDLLGMLAARGCAVVDVPVRPVYAGEHSGLRSWHVLSIAGVVVRRWRRERQRRGKPLPSAKGSSCASP